MGRSRAAAPLEHRLGRRARIAGGAYLLTIVAGVFGEVAVRGRMIVSGDGPATAARILAAQPLYRAGGVADLMMLIAYVLVTVLFLDLFAAVDRSLSRLAAAFSVTGIAVLGADTILHFAPLALLGEAAPRGLPAPEAAHLAAAALGLHAVGYTISTVFFGVYCLLIGWLLWNARFLPRLLGVLMAFAGVGYLGSGVADLMAIILPPVLADNLLLPGLIGEGALGLWLLFRGLDAPAWIGQAAASAR